MNLPPVLHPFLTYTGQGGRELEALAVMVRFANGVPESDLPPGYIEGLCRLAVCCDDELFYFVCTPFPSWRPDPRVWSCEAEE